MAKMKKSEIVLWILVGLALAANIWLPRHMQQKYSWEKDLNQRLASDFCKTRKEVKEYLVKYLPDVTDEQIDEWTASGKLENMQIGKSTMYFCYAARNLFRLDPQLDSIRAAVDGDSKELEGHKAVDAKVIPVIKEDVLANLAKGKENPCYALPKRMRVSFSLTVPAYTLKKGSTLRCWLPYPRQDIGRQTDIKFLGADINGIKVPADKIIFSDSSCCHSSIYMEAKVLRGQATTFHESFEYTSSGEWHPIDSAAVQPYDKESTEYKEYTAELENHVVFTDKIRTLADSLTEGISNPYLQAKAIYTWVDRIPWASAREYSTIPNIPEYVIENRHGDCGQQTLLFMTLCRAKGIPTRWQSGLMMHPGDKNLHDWCQAYFEGYGWVPVDQSFGQTPYGGYFYLGGIDPYRMVINNDLGAQLSPEKKYPRSDTVDFQRGEVEWEGGNLYFTQWDWDFDIEYL